MNSHIRHSLTACFVALFACAQAFSAEAAVSGGVASPGRYKLDRNQGVIALVVQAGGLAPGGCTEVSVMRTTGGKSSLHKINLWELIAEYQPDWMLEPDDVVMVPEHSVPCLRDPKAVNQLLTDYLEARERSTTRPNDWKEKFGPRIGGDGQRDYEGAKKGVREAPGKAGAR